MLRFEIKKVFSKTKNRITIIVLLVILIATSILTINRVEYVDESGNHLTGISAAKNLREAKNEWSGYLTEDVFQNVLEENRSINNEASSDSIEEENKRFAKKQGISTIRDGLFVREGYRTQEEQQQLLDEKIEAYENEGKSKSEAKKLAEQWVAIPGTSEHQLGIAVDINADTTKSSSDDVYSWLAENAHKYGFIKRYPSDKTDITGVINEPWHYRYVGKEAALEIYSQGMCLEEYIDTLE